MLKFDSRIVLLLLNRIVKLYSMVTREIIVELLNFELKNNLFQLNKGFINMFTHIIITLKKIDKHLSNFIEL